MIKRHFWIMSFAGAMVLTGTSHAAESEGFLDKAAVESLVTDHKLTYVRLADGNRVKWDIRTGGALYGENFTQGSKDTARWTIDEKGALCVKWKGNSTDGCRSFSVRDGKTLMFDSTNAALVATVETID